MIVTALLTIEETDWQYAALLAPRSLEPVALRCTARMYPEEESSSAVDVAVRYTGSAITAFNADGTVRTAISMLVPDKLDAAFDHANSLKIMWLRNGTLYGLSTPIPNVTGFALLHEDLRFEAEIRRAALYYTVGNQLFARYSTDNYATATLLETVQTGEYLYTAGMDVNYRMHFTLRRELDVSGEHQPTPEYILTAGDHIVSLNNGAVYMAGD